MNSIVKVKNLSHSYGATVALDNVSFEVEPGEMFGLIGPDGAGKSTLYRILATLLIPTKGEVLVTGLNPVNDYSQIRPKIGYMPERFSLYQDLTINENLQFYASLFGVSVKENYDLIAPIFGQLARFPNRRAGALSGGMKQKLALSCALIHRPKLLLLDEPTTGVDAVSRSEFWDMLSELRKAGITIIVSTSYMDEATRCERIAMINKGQILDIDTPQNLVNKLDENLYSASAGDMFGLLSRLRETPGVKNCYTFGATLHVVTDDSFKPDEVAKQLTVNGMQDVKIYRTKGDIEDLFIKLTRDE